ncbi:DUF3566 domain-containing protein [Kribbella sp. NPDC048915]|uniref:DUF3566 domain-containing protein n=1 Tax=Kribbella sp. NPDC048915 TaxID=3155148 RepID=UPI0033D6531D
MTNRARPTWPEGAADSSKTQRTAPGGKPSAAQANPASNGRSNGQPRPGTPGAPGGAAAPGGPGGPGAAGSNGAPGANGQRPPEYRPPVRPQQSPSTPGRPEPWSAPGAGAGAAVSGAAAYGSEAKTESFGDRMSAARQAVREKAAAVKEAKAERSEAKQERLVEKEPKPSKRPQTRKARLRMARIDPWSVMKTSFLLAIAFGIVVWVAVFIVWSAIGAAGVFDNINSTVQEVLGTPAGEPFRVENYINTGKVMGFTTLLACADVLIITALATLGSFLYNIAATLLGGLEVTLASED